MIATLPTNGGQNPAAELLTDETAADIIGVEPRTVRDWRMRLG